MDVNKVYRGHKSSRKLENFYHRLVYGTQKLQFRVYSNDIAHELQHRTDGEMNGQQD